MNAFLRLALSVLCLAFPIAQAQPAASPAAASEAIARLRTYQFGQDRAILDAVDKLVVASLADPELRATLAQELAAILKTDASYDAKQFVCRELAWIATEKEVPALARALSDQDPNLAQMALYALVRVPGPATDEALRAALARSTASTQLGVIDALGERRDPRAVTQLRPLLQGNEAVAAAAASALGKIGGGDAAKALEATFPKAQGSFRVAVADALLVCANQLLAAGDARSAQPIYVALYADAASPRLQAAGLRGLVKSEGEKALPKLLESLRDEGSPRQEMAAALAREMVGSEVIAQVASLLSKLTPSGQILVLAALADRGDRSALPAVQPLCSSTEASVRLAALQTLGSIGDASTVPFLAAHAASGPANERDVARASLAALRGWGSPAVAQPREWDVDAALVKALPGADPGTQVEIIRALGQRNATQAVPALLKTSAGSDRTVRLASWRTLRDLARFQDLPVLVDLLLKSEAADRDEAETTVVAVVRLGSDDSQQTRLLLDRLARVQGTSDRCTLLRVLGQIGRAESLSALRSALTDNPPEVRLTVTRALADWSGDEPLNDLLAIAKSAQDPQLRAVALRGYIRLIGLNESRRADEALALYREAMALASNPAEKRLVLSGLATLKSPATLDLAAAQLADPALRQEAEVAVLQIARGVAGADPAKTKAAIEQVLAGTQDDAARKQAQEVLALIGKFGDYVMAWEYSPAYTQSDVPVQGLFDLPFAPEIPAQAGAVNWRLLPTGTNPDQPWLLDLLAALGGESRVAYLRTRLHSDKARSLVLELGSDDGIKVWLNGHVVHGHNVLRAIEPGQEKVAVNLNEGWNELLLKVTQNNMGWGACARFRNADGSPVDGLKFDCAH
jgi:HEAT repeat protein